MAEETSKKFKLYGAVGRRKTSIANILLKEGDGKIKVNGLDFNKYFVRGTHQIVIKRPLEILGLADKFNVRASVSGGGVSGQADAVKLGIARALVEFNKDYRTLLSKNRLLTRDSRMVERKKPGRAGARKRFQFSKR